VGEGWFRMWPLGALTRNANKTRAREQKKKVRMQESQTTLLRTVTCERKIEHKIEKIRGREGREKS
jgi:hypothetical protein